MSRYQKKWMLKTAPDVRTIILTHTFIDSIPLLFHFQANKCNQRPLNFSINHWYQIKSRSNEISQIKLTLLLLFLLFAEHKGISSNGTIHNIMADGIFIQNSMIAESNCGMNILFNNHHKHSIFNSSQGKWIFLHVLAYQFCKLYYLRGKLKTTWQVVFYTYRVVTLLNYKKKTKQNKTQSKQTDDRLQESILLFSGLRNIEEPIRL